jgi:hypothetical protein
MENLSLAVDELLLLRYLKVCDFDSEKAGQLLTCNLELREKYPHIFFDRDLSCDKLQQALRTL